MIHYARLNTNYKYLRKNVRIKIIAIINPWGFNQIPKSYPNSRGVNPNRNFDCLINHVMKSLTTLDVRF